MSKFYKAIQDLNDKYILLDLLLEEFDKALANTTEVNAIYDDECSHYYTDVTVIDEDGIVELRKIYDKLEEIIKEN